MEGTGSPLASLVTKFIADSSGFDTGLKQMQDKAESFGDRLIHIGEKIATGLAIFAVGEQAFEAAEKFEKATFAIEKATGATGEQLKGLEESFKAVYAQTARSADEVAGAISQVAIRTHLAGEELERFTVTNLRLTKIVGGDLKGNIEQTQRLFGAWGISTEQQKLKLDELVTVSQRTGVNFSQLTTTMQIQAPVLKSLGYSFEQSAALIGSFEQHGIATDKVTAALNKGLVTLASKGIKEPEVALRALIERMQEAKTDTEAIDQATVVFGKRSGVFMAGAVRQGAFAIRDLTEAQKSAAGTIDDLADKTKTLGDRWEIFKHLIEEALLPLGAPLLKALTDGTDKLKGFSKEVQVAVDWFSKVPGPVKATAAALVILPVAIELVIGTFTKFLALEAVVWFKAVATSAIQAGLFLTGLQGPLTASAASFLTWGANIAFAVGVAAAAFAGWKLGEWLEDKFPTIRKLELGFNELLRVFGHDKLLSFFDGTADSEKELRANTDKLAESLKKLGIEVKVGPNASVYEYRDAVMKAAEANKALIAASEKHTDSTNQNASAQDALNRKLQAQIDSMLNAAKHQKTLLELIDEDVKRRHDQHIQKVAQSFVDWSLSIGQVTRNLAANIEAFIKQDSVVAVTERDLALMTVNFLDSATAARIRAAGVTREQFDASKDLNAALKLLNVTTDDEIEKQRQLAEKAIELIALNHSFGEVSDEEFRRASEAYQKQIGATDALTDAFKRLGIQSDAYIDKQIEIDANAYNLIRHMYELGLVSAEAMQRATDAITEKLAPSLKATEERVANGLTKELQKTAKTGTEAINQIGRALTGDLSRAISDVIFQTGKISDAFIKMGKDVVDIVLNHIIEGALKPLLHQLDVLLGKIPGLGGIFGTTSGGGSNPASSPGGAAGSVVSGLVGGLAGWIGVGVSAISGIVSGVQQAHANNLLDLIEKSTRFTWIVTGGNQESIFFFTKASYQMLVDIRAVLNDSHDWWVELLEDVGSIRERMAALIDAVNALPQALKAPGISSAFPDLAHASASSVTTNNFQITRSDPRQVVNEISKYLKIKSPVFVT